MVNDYIDLKVRRLLQLLLDHTDIGSMQWLSASAKGDQYLAVWDDASVVVTKIDDQDYSFKVLNVDGDAVLSIDTREDDSSLETVERIRQLYRAVHAEASSSVRIIDTLIARLAEPPF